MPALLPLVFAWKGAKGPKSYLRHLGLPGSPRRVYIGVAKDVEHRFYTHYLYGDVEFLPTIEELEDSICARVPAPYYEIVDTVPDCERLQRERAIAEAFRGDPYVSLLLGGR